KCGVGLQKPRLPANTFGRHCSIELYRQSQYTLSSPIVIPAHQGACAFAGCRPTNTLARALMVAKIKRVIVSLHAQCRNNTDRLSIFVADNQPPVLSAFPPESGHSSRRFARIWNVLPPRCVTNLEPHAPRWIYPRRAVRHNMEKLKCALRD